MNKHINISEYSSKTEILIAFTLNNLNFIQNLLLSVSSDKCFDYRVYIADNCQLAIGKLQLRVITLHFQRHPHPQPHRHRHPHRRLKSLKRDKSTWAITQYRIVGIIVYLCICNIVSVYLQLQLQLLLCVCVSVSTIEACWHDSATKIKKSCHNNNNNNCNTKLQTNFGCNWLGEGSGVSRAIGAVGRTWDRLGRGSGRSSALGPVENVEKPVKSVPSQ